MSARAVMGVLALVACGVVEDPGVISGGGVIAASSRNDAGAAGGGSEVAAPAPGGGGGSTLAGDCSAIAGGVCFNGGECCGPVCCLPSSICCMGQCRPVSVDLPPQCFGGGG